MTLMHGKKNSKYSRKKKANMSHHSKELKTSTNLRLHKQLVGDNGKDGTQESTPRFQRLGDIHHVKFMERVESTHFLKQAPIGTASGKYNKRGSCASQNSV